MSPPGSSEHPAFLLYLLDKAFHVSQISTKVPIPEDVLSSLLVESHPPRFVSITRTAEEVSIVREAEHADEKGADWRCIRIAGPMDFGITGVMCNFATPLRDAGVPIFAVSTWNTDYILVPTDKVIAACEAAVALKEDLAVKFLRI